MSGFNALQMFLNQPSFVFKKREVSCEPIQNTIAMWMSAIKFFMYHGQFKIFHNFTKNDFVNLRVLNLNVFESIFRSLS